MEAMEQVFQIAGAVAILVAFVALQLRALDAMSWPYLFLNVIGAGVLAVVAVLDRDWGFVLLETVWTAVSGWSIVRKVRAKGDERTVRLEGLEPPAF